MSSLTTLFDLWSKKGTIHAQSSLLKSAGAKQGMNHRNHLVPNYLRRYLDCLHGPDWLSHVRLPGGTWHASKPRRCEARGSQKNRLDEISVVSTRRRSGRLGHPSFRHSVIVDLVMSRSPFPDFAPVPAIISPGGVPQCPLPALAW